MSSLWDVELATYADFISWAHQQHRETMDAYRKHELEPTTLVRIAHEC